MSSIFDDFDDEDLDLDGYVDQVNNTRNRKRNRARQRKKDEKNEVGKAPPLTPELQEELNTYKHNFIEMHKHVFPDSTGVKPFGEVQQLSILRGQDVFHNGGRLLKLEPRGYAKTTRIANEALFAVLCGLQDYVLIVCSNVTKAQEILDSINTELQHNDKLLELFPATISCFRHLENNAQKGLYQSYDGDLTYIKSTMSGIRFPAIKDSTSSGKYIEIRPLTNLKGLFHKVKAGPDVGKVFRPTLVILDDPQTYADANSPAVVEGIVNEIKRSALRGGSHSRRVSAIMAITPVCHGDVAYHFEKNEHSWEIVRYKMLEKKPDQEELWLTTYAQIYTNYDRLVRGDRMRAALEARKYVEDNYELLHKGSEVTWEFAYGWNEDPQIEISPVQHAYNIIIDDGMKDFEFECQCNTEYGTYEEGETIHAQPEQIVSKVLPLPRGKVPQDTRELVAHIDVNKDILSYTVLCSPKQFRPHLIDYGTHPKQPARFSKRAILIPLKSVYQSTTDYREILYLATRDLIEMLANRAYVREDGVNMFVSMIGVDIRYEEDYIKRALKDSPFRSKVLPTWGLPVGPDDDLLHERRYPEGCRIYDNCVEKPNADRTMDYLNVDANFFKTEVHKAWNKEVGLKGSLTMFTPEHDNQHKVIADHCNVERPERTPGKKQARTRICWIAKSQQPDNEYFDNITACFALFTRQGITIKPTDEPKSQVVQHRTIDMSTYMNQQKGKKLL